MHPLGCNSQLGGLGPGFERLSGIRSCQLKRISPVSRNTTGPRPGRHAKVDRTKLVLSAMLALPLEL